MLFLHSAILIDSTLSCGLGLLELSCCLLNTDTDPVFFSMEFVVLAKLMFISLVLFWFDCFTLSEEAGFQAVYTKCIYSDPNSNILFVLFLVGMYVF